jgi:predicted kinase
MATAHLIHGFLGVGKTTLARRLEQLLGQRQNNTRGANRPEA